jgi:hypothetical protein
LTALTALTLWIASTIACADEAAPGRPTVEYELPPVIKVRHEGRELRCFDAGEDWRTLNRVFVDYRAFHVWAALVERDRAAAGRDILQLETQLNSTRQQLDLARSGWDFYRSLHRDERTLRLRSKQTNQTVRLLLGGGLAAAVVVIAVESVVLAVR